MQITLSIKRTKKDSHKQPVPYLSLDTLTLSTNRLFHPLQIESKSASKTARQPSEFPDKNGQNGFSLFSSIRLLDKLEEKEYDTCAEGVVRFESSPRYQFHQPVKVGKYQIQ